MRSYLPLALLLSGCTAPPDRCADAAPSLRLGTGDVALEPLDPGATVDLVHGPQGGWHLLVSVGATGTADAVHLGLQLTELASQQLVADSAYDLLLVRDTACEGLAIGLFAYLDTSAIDPDRAADEVLSGAELRLDVALRDADGLVLSDSVTVVAR